MISRSTQVAAVVAVTATCLLAACSAGVEPSGTSPSEIASHPLTKLEAAPEKVPNLMVDGQPISPAFVDWHVNGEHVTSRTAPDQDDAVLPTVTAGFSTLRLEFDSNVGAAQLYVTFFTELDARGVPMDAAGDEIDVLRRRPDARLNVARGR